VASRPEAARARLERIWRFLVEFASETSTWGDFFLLLISAVQVATSGDR
jgi:hypothetical protein